MQQNPYCRYCLNSLYIDEDQLTGLCDKCSICNPLTSIEIGNYFQNQKCKTICECGGYAYVHDENTFYTCGCCFKQILLTDATKQYLENKKVKRLDEGIKYFITLSLKNDKTILRNEGKTPIIKKKS